ncbi:sensor histidine kinase [Roseateles depolymerans]|uniref:histidine kinase n=1 Tax=Roseateles depolymerans TaxID=76731 RepID=A0A0U3MGX3_9BURK|nr:ATP-binding protein [Roseateles depolymerans]ALV07657.1 histidine kinase [Roseateles depolymerans]REG22121.1 signal transduction histidine kinase [Roseateles depolymerans]
MKALYLRIYITVVVVLLAFALGSAWLFQGRIEQERGTFEQAASERLVAMAVLVQRALPPATAPTHEQSEAIEDWGQRLRMALALEDARGRRVGASPLFERREDLPGSRIQRIPLDDGRHLLFLRIARPPGTSGPLPGPGPFQPEQRPSGALAGGERDGRDGREIRDGRDAREGRDSREGRDARGGGAGGGNYPGGPFRDGAGPSDGSNAARQEGAASPSAAASGNRRDALAEVEATRQRMMERLEQERRAENSGSWFPGWIPRPSGEALASLLVVLFLAVSGGAYPVVRRLTRRLESLKSGVEQFGGGDLAFRVHDQGKDEIAALAGSFNRAAEKIQTLVSSHKSLLANASHELRSPLARLKMAFAMLDEASPAQRVRLQQEINTNIGELDALVEEVLLASRLEGGAQSLRIEPVDLLGIAAEEAARTGAEVEAEAGLEQLQLRGDDRLLRRALRNLLENARRYGGPQVEVKLRRVGTAHVEVQVCDRGPGVPESQRERIFEAFYRMPGHAEVSGGVGLGLNLVKQIALAHSGTVRCEGREGGGSCFAIRLPLVPTETA